MEKSRGKKEYKETKRSAGVFSIQKFNGRQGLRRFRDRCIDQEENIALDLSEELQILTEMWVRRLGEEGYLVVAI